MHPPDPEMRRGGPPQATPDIANFQHRKLYHISPDVQAFIALLAPLCLVLLLLAIGGRP
jgi:hypothetical protein